MSPSAPPSSEASAATARSTRRAGCLFGVASALLAIGCASAPGPADSGSAEPNSDEPAMVGEPAPNPTPSAPPAEADPGGRAPGTKEPTREAEDSDDGTLWYRIDLSERSLRVRLRLLDPPEHAHFFLPSASGQTGRLDDRFRISYARGPDRRRSHRLHRRRGRIDVETGDAPWIELVYRVRFGPSPPDAKLPAPRVSNGTLLAHASTFLIVPSRHIVRPIHRIPVEVHAPESWRLLSTWRRRRAETSERDANRRVYGFVPRDFRRLRDAFLVGGNRLKIHRIGRRERQIEIAFDASYRADPKATAQIISRIVERYRRRFGSLGPVTAYVRSRSDASEGTKRGTSRRGGFVVALPPDRLPGDRETLLIAHEAFHLWNGHALVPSPAHSETTRWFMEGATQYIALKTVRRLGLIEREAVLDEIARSASAYLDNPATRRGHASRFDRRRLPYDRGFLLALAFDAELARTSGGEIGLETWFRTMLEKRGGQKLYTLDDLERELRQISPEKGRVMQMWQRHVEAEDQLAPRQIFRSIGLRYISSPTRAELEPTSRSDSRSALYRRLFPGPNDRSD